ncbi:MAG: hypothetical protein JWM34_5294 [Ilumatobacteraceae bacterium]|nr:hypothetical protein [Ilumatobacteraceae bacterium]
MDAATVAEATATAVSGLSSGFMLDGRTYKKGAELGFQGIDFYFAGRGGVLGDVCGDVVTSAFCFFAPGQVTTAWENSRDVMSRADAASEFAGCMYRWADAHLDADVDWVRLAELADTIVASATVAAAPLFAAWRSGEASDDPRAAALYRMNLLRELRMARHGAAVIALGLEPADAVRHRTPQMLGIFGWEPGEVSSDFADAWAEAEALTNRATAHDYAVLDDAEAAELVRLCDAAMAAVH